VSAYSIIDVDTHVTETPDVWVDRVPARMRDKVPYVDVDKRGRQCWFLNGKRMSIIGLTATAGRGDMQNWPATYDDMHPGAYDANERLKYMDEMGIWAMVMYPNVAGFGNQQFLQLGDPELMLACVEAYNDWQTEWASADPRRLLPVASTPFWDIDAAVKEVRRCAEMGHKGILFTGEPQAFGQPFMGDRHWDPLWETAVELGLPISFHIGSGDMEDGLAREKVAAYGRMSTFTSGSVNVFLKNGFQLAELLLSGIFVRHPEVQFVSVESGVGWIPYALHRMDFEFEDRFRDLMKLKPSEYWRRQCRATFQYDPIGAKLVDDIGIETIMWGSDYPHTDGIWPESTKYIDEQFAGLTPEQIHKITCENAAKFYRLSN